MKMQKFSLVKRKLNLKEYGFKGYTRIKWLIETKRINGEYKDNLYLVDEVSLLDYIKEIDYLRENYISVEDFFEEVIGFRGAVNLDTGKEFIKNLNLELLEIEYPVVINKRNVTKLVNKKSLEEFKKVYKCLNEEQKLYVYQKGMPSYLRRNNIKLYSPTKNKKYIFIRNDEWEMINRPIVTLRNACKDLKLSMFLLDLVLQEYNIERVYGAFRENDHAYIYEKDLSQLIQIQEKVLKEYRSKYITLEELTQLLNAEGIGKPKGNLLDRCRSVVTIPNIIKIEELFNKNVLYDRKAAEEHIESSKYRKKLLYIKSKDTTDFYEIFKEVVDMENLTFSANARITKELWFKYVEFKLNNSLYIENNSLVRNQINIYVATTKELTRITSEKEIYECTEKELKLAVFNNNGKKKVKRELKSFLRNLNDEIEHKSNNKVKHFKFLEEVDYRQINVKKSGNVDIYTLEEYFAVYEYVKDLQLHKSKSLEGLKAIYKRKLPNNNRYYMKHESMWLYLIIHLCNGWRHGDVVSLPRVSIDHLLKVDSIEELQNLDLDFSLANKIVKFYQTQYYEVNKTKVINKLYCSKQLVIPFAYAIALCEFRCRFIDIQKSSHLINFFTAGNLVTKGIHKSFFKDFKFDFEFKSRKMNSTVLVYTDSILKDSNLEPLEIAQNLRGHLSNKSTNVYYKIPAEHFDFITEQLFDIGYYGYVYTEMSRLVHNENNSMKDIETIKSIKSIVGDIFKVEDLAKYLNRLISNDEEVVSYLSSIGKEELRKKLNLINLGVTPSKQEGYQCLFSNCLVYETDCDKCPFSIPHFYSLNIIAERIKKNLKYYLTIMNDAEVVDGEKVKTYKLLIKDFKNILEAKNSFGEEVIEMIIKENFSNFINSFFELPCYSID